MTAKVPMMDIGSARLGMMVAERLRRKRKMTRTTRHRASSRVNLTSLTESRIDTERSIEDVQVDGSRQLVRESAAGAA